MPDEKKVENDFPFSLSRSGSLKGRDQIRFVLRRGKRFTLNGVEFAVVSHSSATQVCVSLSRKVGKAHDRNRLKRQIREALASLPPPTKPLKIMVMGRSPVTIRDFGAFRQELARELETFG